MSETTEELRQRLLKRRIRVVTIVFSLIGILCASIYFTLAPKTKSDPTDISLTEGSVKREEIRLGLLAPLQGERKAYGESILRGATLAAKVINENGGVLGKNIKILTADTRSSTELAAELTTNFIQRAKVPLVIGTASEEASLAAAKAATAGKTPFIYLGNGHLKTCSSKNSQELNPYVLTTGFTEHMSVEPFLIYLADKFRRPESKFRIYYFGTDDDAAIADAEFTQNIAVSLGFETVAEEFVDGRIKDYFRKIRAIFKKRPDVLVVTTSKSASPGFLKQVAKLGVKVEMAVAGIKPFESELVVPVADALEEVYSAAGYVADIDSDANRSFLEQWNKLYPTHKPTDLAVAGAYTAVLLAKAAFEKAGTTDTTAVIEALKTTEVEAPQGRVSINAHNNTLVKPLFATQFKNGSYVVDEYLGDVSHPSLEACGVATEEKPVDG